MTLILFLLGLAIGSFINVLSIRYKPGRRIFNFKKIKGRSHCPDCGKKLEWHELIPLLSFVFQLGRCRLCRARLSFQYPAVELASGLILAFIPTAVFESYQVAFGRLPDGSLPLWYYLAAGIFVLASLTMIFLSAVDFRLKIIPDQSNLLIAVLGIALILTNTGFGLYEDNDNSFLSHYALLFGFEGNIWLNRLAAALFAAAPLGLIVFLSRGRGMGLGDVKLAGVIGLFLGWPDTVLALALAFIVGAIWSIILIAGGRKKMKSAVPFGPFIVLGTFLVIFFGKEIMDFYFKLFP